MGSGRLWQRHDRLAGRCRRRQEHAQPKTYCQSLPRIYSGLAFDFCVLNAPPDPSGFLVPFVLLDLPLSAVFDTVALPYTVYRQVTDGNLGIYWRKGGY